MKKIFFITVITIVLYACNNSKTNVENSTQPLQDTLFNDFKARFVLNLWKNYPEWATSVGFHEYDSLLTISNEVTSKKNIDFSMVYLDSLKKFEQGLLSTNNQTDYEMIKNQLESNIWYAKEFKSNEWNPSDYNVGGIFSEVLNAGVDSINIRLTNIKLKLKSVPAYYQAAIANIKNPTKEHTILAVEQNKGAISIFAVDIPDAVKKSNLSKLEKEEINTNCKQAMAAINNYVNWLEKLDNKQPRNAHIGKKLYEKKFNFDIQSQYSADEIYMMAMQRKSQLHQSMMEIAIQLWPKYFNTEKMPSDTLVAIKKLIDKLSINHVHRDSFQTAIEQQLPVLENFIKQKNLLYIDPAKPLVVRKEPAYMQGVAGASISAPGPYDKFGNTYYNVGTLANYSAADAESFLKEYNDYILQILNIHEAIPGHYTQLVYSNNSPSIIKALFGNGAMVEGWAVYTERMMLENGYAGATPEMWLMYYKWHLRSVCNTILDYSIHVKDMTEKEAMHLLIDEAFQQQKEASGKYRRVSLTQVQLCSYFTGFTEIYNLREALKKKQGNQFDVKKFHETFLGFGSAPVKYISKAMLN